jgi:DNA-directed RNA polymerase beta' subunit
MGSVMDGVLCTTCHNTSDRCSGHLGLIELARAVWHPTFWSGHALADVLRRICFFCSKLLATSSGRCGHCQFCGASAQPKYKRVGQQMVLTWPDGHVFANPEEEAFCKAPFTPDACRKVLADIDPQHVASFGTSASTRLEDVFTPISILVLPSTLRRPAFVKGVRRDDMTTRAIADIIRANEELRQRDLCVSNALSTNSAASAGSAATGPHAANAGGGTGGGTGGDGGAADHEVTAIKKKQKKTIKRNQMTSNGQRIYLVETDLDDLRDSAQDAFVNLTHKVFAHFTADQDNNGKFSQPKHKTALTKETKSLRDLLSSKDGWLRRHMLSGRIPNCSRAVAAPDMSIDVDQIVLPLEIALTLSKPCIVANFNIGALADCVVRGAAVYGGAQSVSFSDTHTVTLGGMPLAKRRSLADSLHIGCVVHRSLQDNDRIVFNRQPTLHKFGMLCQRVKVDRHPFDRTIRLPPELCGPTNADFDGDEVNCNMLSTPAGQADARVLMSPETMMESNRAVFGAIQDIVMGAALLTQENQTGLHPHTFATLVGAIVRPAQPHRHCRSDDRRCAREVVELLFPPTFAYNYRGVHIVDGRFCSDSAPLSKHHLERGPRSVAAILTLDFSARQALHFLSDLRRLVTVFLNTVRSVTVEFADIVPDAASLAKFRAAEADAMDKYARCNAAAANGAHDDREQLIALAHLPAVAEDLASRKQLDLSSQGWAREFNGMTEFVSSGGKGSWRNVAQMSVGIGQQVIVDDRLARGADGRTLPTFELADTSAAADGWVHESYLQGMNPSSMFIAACGGRAGVAATYCRTAECGYLFRRMYSLLNCLLVDYVGVTRGSDGRVVMAQYLDGFLPDTLEAVDCSAWLWEPQPRAEVEALRRQLVNVRRRCAVASHVLYVPVDWCRLRAMSASVTRAQAQVPVGWDRVQAFLDSLERLAAARGYNLLQLRLHIAHAASCGEEALAVGQFEWLVAETLRRVQRCSACAGTPVGSTASEKTESSTQTTLRSFHTAGQAMSRDDLKNLLLLAERKNHVVSATVQLADAGARGSQQKTADAAALLLPVRLAACISHANDLACCVASGCADQSLAQRVDKEWARAQRLGIVGGCRKAGDVLVWEATLGAREVGRLETTLHGLVDRVAAQLPDQSAVWAGSPATQSGGGGGSEHAVVLYIAASRSNALTRAAIRKLLVGGDANVIHAKCVAVANCDTHAGPQFAVQLLTRSVPILANYCAGFDLTTLRLDCPIATTRHWGIEAALSVLAERLDSAFCAPDGRFAHHSSLIASFLCMRGVVHKLDRFDIHKLNTDVLSMAAFESPVPVLQEAALRGVTNDAIRRSTTASTILSTTPKIGSGLVELIVPVRARASVLRDTANKHRRPQQHSVVGHTAGEPQGHKFVWWDLSTSGQDYLSQFDQLVSKRVRKRANRRARTVPLVALRPEAALLAEVDIAAK